MKELSSVPNQSENTGTTSENSVQKRIELINRLEMKDSKPVTEGKTPAFESLSSGYSAKDDAIEKHLQPLLRKDSLDYLSFKYAVESGTISGGLRLALHKMLESYADQQIKELELIISEQRVRILNHCDYIKELEARKEVKEPELTAEKDKIVNHLSGVADEFGRNGDERFAAGIRYAIVSMLDGSLNL